MSKIDEERLGPVAVLTPGGSLDLTTLPVFGARLDRLLEDGVRAVLWDLGDVDLLPSSALGFFLQARRRLEDVGGRMGLARASTMVRRALSSMGVLDVFPIYKTREEGIAALTALTATSEQ